MPMAVSNSETAKEHEVTEDLRGDESWWEFDPETFEPTEDDVFLGAPPWRRRLLIAVAGVVVTALLLIPVFNVLSARQVADNGLVVCGFDYCEVQDAVVEAGLDRTMSLLANTFLTEEEAFALASELTSRLGIPPVGLEVLPRLEGSLGGFYDPATRSIKIERPARAWIVLHEVAHAVHSGHAEDFQAVLIEMLGWMSESGGPDA